MEREEEGEMEGEGREGRTWKATSKAFPKVSVQTELERP